MKAKCLFIFILAACLIAGSAEAQNKTFSVSGPEGSLQVQYLVEKGSSTLLLCRYEPAAGKNTGAPYLKNISGKTRICTPNGDYSLLKTTHIPVRNEADVKYAFIKGQQAALNFVLEFEKFPHDGPFDLVEEDGESDFFAIRGLTAGTQETGNVDVADFLAGTGYSEYGYSYEDGQPIHYFNDSEIYLASTAWPYSNPAYYFLSVGFQIENRGTSPITVKFDDVSASAFSLNRNQRQVKCNVSVLNEKDADSNWKEMDKLEVMNQLPENAGQEVADMATRAALIPDIPGLGAVGLLALGMAIRSATEPDYEPYLTERNAEREEIMKSYLKETTISPGESCSAFVSLKYYKEPASTTVSIKLNGETYSMKY